jgi:3-deoxy-D-manno-octulosonic-acid transferase
VARSLALGLYLLLAERGRAATSADRPARPEGKVLWIHVGPTTRPESLRQILRLLVRDRADLALVLTLAPEPRADLPDMPGSYHVETAPPEKLPAIRAFLDHWHPDAGLFVGLNLPPALITEAAARRVPLMMADAETTSVGTPLWRRGMIGSTLTRFARVFARDTDSLAALRVAGGRSLNVELAGAIEDVAEPLSCNEAEREDLAGRLRARPVWLAAACPEAEERAVIEAHVHALNHAHRLLLVLAPTDPDRADAIAGACAALDLVAARRNRDEEPDEDVQVLIADGTGELGLWYRLAPVTYLGGTLSGPEPARSPFEAAALGSALVVGPQAGFCKPSVDRLVDARAARRVVDRDDLRAAIADLIAPDKAAVLAHNAWVATTGGLDVAERTASAVLQLVHGADAARPVTA